MKAALQYLKFSLLPVVIVLLLFFLYVKIFCAFSSVSSVADLVCFLKWKDGLFLVISYAVVKLLSSIIGLKKFSVRLLAILVLYSFMFGLMAFPYWLSSFGQPFVQNVFLHLFLIILVVEGLFDHYS